MNSEYVATLASQKVLSALERCQKLDQVRYIKRAIDRCLGNRSLTQEMYNSCVTFRIQMEVLLDYIQALEDSLPE